MKQKRLQLGLYAALLLVTLIFMFMLGKCSSKVASLPGERLDEAAGGDTLNVAIEYSPTSVYLYADTLGGFNYDLLRQLSARYDIPMRIQPMVSLEASLEYLRQGKTDMVVAELPMTLDYSTEFEFTEPSYLDRQVLVQRRDSAGNVEVETQLDLANRHVWVAASSPAIARLRNLSSEIGDTIYVETTSELSPEQLVMSVAVGEIPLAVVNRQTALAFASDYPDLDISTAVSFTQLQSWLLRRSDTVMRQRLDSALIEFKSSPAYDRLLGRYNLR